MKRIGEFGIPEMTLSDAVEVVRHAHRAFGTSFSRESLAGVLKLRGRGGWFAAIVASLRLWGLAEGRGSLRLTAIGVRLARAQTIGEVTLARREAMLGVPLLREITARSPDAAPGRTDLALMLAEITGADAGRVHSSLPQVRRILADAWPVASDTPSLPPYRTPYRPTEGGAAIPAPAVASDVPAERSLAIEISFSGGRLSLPETPENLEMAASLLRRRAGELSGKSTG